MKINLAKVLITSLLAFTLGTALSQVDQANHADDPTYGAFDGSYERNNVLGINRGSNIILNSAKLTINKDSGTHKVNNSGRCYNKEVPIEVIKKTNESIVIRLKFTNTYVDCIDEYLEFNLVVVNGVVGLARAHSKVLEFEKKDIKNEPLQNPKSASSGFNGIYEVNGYVADKDLKPARLSDANLLIDGNNGRYKFINARGKCYTKELPVEISNIDAANNTLTLNILGSTAFPDCKDYKFKLNTITSDGYSGLAFEGSTKLAYKKLR